MTHSGADIAALLAAHGLRPSRALGQNFVADPNTVRRIARLAGVGPGSSVLEFGAGLGSLSLALAETGARVVAVELDRYLLPVLRSVAEPAGVEVVEGDAMTLDVAGLLAERGGGPWSLVANLPYNIATPLVFKTLVEVPAVEHLLFMVQREVGERMAARVGDPAYGSVSVRVAYFATSKVVGRVPASVFIPRPRVESVLVRMDRLAVPAVDTGEVSYERLAAVVKAGFGQRRKMLRGSLAGVVDPDAFSRAGIRPDARAEELNVEEWGRLAR
ncbi:MAG TPA: 16S rRNA (adenine(1518)-N(6)/adenine(1519)-N(6))-dimethyltransferase RsmA [Acidimicrobiales bacterium]|nr:16S rRNA (adenine(1518)-N(6)/adenine(1519)-N(6))-dimethyltransferase RsmA [Acidimicrobiales bacterium]